MKKIHRFHLQKFSFSVLRHFHQQLDWLWCWAFTRLVVQGGQPGWKRRPQNMIFKVLHPGGFKMFIPKMKGSGSDVPVTACHTHWDGAPFVGVFPPPSHSTSGLNTSCKQGWPLTAAPDGAGDGCQGELDSPGEMMPRGASGSWAPFQHWFLGQRAEALRGWCLWGRDVRITDAAVYTSGDQVCSRSC